MSGAVTLNPGTGGSSVLVETPTSPTGGVMPVTKIHTGTLDIDGGPVTATNPLHVQALLGTTAEIAAGIQTTIFPTGLLRTTDEPTQVFYDPFDGVALDTQNWNAAVSAGGGSAASVASGQLQLGTGTTANGYSYLQSNVAFRPVIPGWLGVSMVVQIEAAVVANTFRFWGQATLPVTPTAAAPITNGVGWEIATDGKMYAVVYAAGARTVIQDLSAATGNGKQPTDGGKHRYIVYTRTDRSYWYIDNLDTPVATSSFQAPAVQVLPITYLAVAGSVAPTLTGLIQVPGVAAWDTGKNNRTISDGTYPQRKATVKAAAVAPTTADPSLVVAISPTTGRTRVAITFQAVAPAVADTLLSISKNTGGTVTSGTSITATAGKRLIITGGYFSVKANAAAAAFATMTLRNNSTGATVLASPSLFRADVGNTAATAGAADSRAFTFGDGFEFTGTDSIGISLAAQAITNIISISLHGYEIAI